MQFAGAVDGTEKFVTYRADITRLRLVSAGANTLTISDMSPGRTRSPASRRPRERRRRRRRDLRHGRDSGDDPCSRRARPGVRGIPSAAGCDGAADLRVSSQPDRTRCHAGDVCRQRPSRLPVQVPPPTSFDHVRPGRAHRRCWTIRGRATTEPTSMAATRRSRSRPGRKPDGCRRSPAAQRSPGVARMERRCALGSGRPIVDDAGPTGVWKNWSSCTGGHQAPIARSDAC